LLDGRLEFAGDCAADDGPLELETRAARPRFEFHPHLAELAAAARLLLMPVGAIALARDSFAIGNAWRFKVSFDAGLLLEAVNGHVQMRVAQSSQNRLANFRISPHAQRRVLLDEPMHAHADLFLF